MSHIDVEANKRPQRRRQAIYYVPWRALSPAALERVIAEIWRSAADGIRLSQWPELSQMQRRLEQLQAEAIPAGAE